MQGSLSSLTSFLQTDTARLMLTYLGIIMVMTCSFSAVIYSTSVAQLEHQRPPSTGYDDTTFGAPRGFYAFINQRIDEGKRAILDKLIVINLLVLGGGAVLSYYLARKSLEPIEQAMEVQSQFVSDASHELRTPLTALRTTNEVALRRKKLTLNDARLVIQENLDEVDRLQQLTDGLLRLSSNDTSLRLENTALQPLVETALATVALRAHDKDISVDNQIPAINILADAGALTQVLTILLDNAIKYSPPSSSITLTATHDAKQGTYIHVSDRGVGIAPEDISYIFTRFYRADQSRSQTQGYGLGLPIAHKLVEAHRGTLSVVSTPDQGSTFTVHIPPMKRGV